MLANTAPGMPLCQLYCRSEREREREVVARLWPGMPLCQLCCRSERERERERSWRGYDRGCHCASSAVGQRERGCGGVMAVTTHPGARAVLFSLINVFVDHVRPSPLMMTLRDPKLLSRGFIKGRIIYPHRVLY